MTAKAIKFEADSCFGGLVNAQSLLANKSPVWNAAVSQVKTRENFFRLALARVMMVDDG
jgi:acyl-CoA thioesterase